RSKRDWSSDVCSSDLTQALVAATDVLLRECANCLVVLGRRAEEERIAAALVLATTRADVNSTVRKTLQVRKASFMPMERAVTERSEERRVGRGRRERG